MNDKSFELSQTISKYQDARFSILHTRFMDDDNVHLVKGKAAETIASFFDSNSVDLLVMGTVARKG